MISQTNTTLLTTPFMRETIGRGENDPEEKDFLQKLQEQKQVKEGDASEWGFSKVWHEKLENLECNLSQ